MLHILARISHYIEDSSKFDGHFDTYVELLQMNTAENVMNLKIGNIKLMNN